MQFNLIEVCIGVAGVFIVVNGIIIMLSEKYYDLFSKVLFIEKISDADKQILSERLREDHGKSRYAMGSFAIFFGFTAIAWALGMKSALGWPFNLLF